jgi:hypothetical protein
MRRETSKYLGQLFFLPENSLKTGVSNELLPD